MSARIVRTTERNIARLSKLVPGDVVRIYTKYPYSEYPYGEEYDIATVGQYGFTPMTTKDENVVEGRINLIVKTQYGTTNASIYVSCSFGEGRYMSFTDEAEQDNRADRGCASTSSNYHIAIEIPSKKEAK